MAWSKLRLTWKWKKDNDASNSKLALNEPSLSGFAAQLRPYVSGLGDLINIGAWIGVDCIGCFDRAVDAEAALIREMRRRMRKGLRRLDARKLGRVQTFGLDNRIDRAVARRTSMAEGKPLRFWQAIKIWRWLPKGQGWTRLDKVRAILHWWWRIFPLSPWAWRRRRLRRLEQAFDERHGITENE